MRRILSYPFAILVYVLFFLVLCVFHPVQWICLNLFGYNAHKKSVDALNGCLIFLLYFLISDFRVENLEVIPEGKPLIFVANHQGLYDIVCLGWFMRKFHPKYVSKIELGKGIPSVSYNLNHGGSVLIDRKDPKQALPVLRKMAEYIELNKRSTVIFPEGTRSKTGVTKPFASSGLKILCKYAPNAYVVPVTINNCWKIFQYGGFPLAIGNRLKLIVHEPIAVSAYDFDTLFAKAEQAINSRLEI